MDRICLNLTNKFITMALENGIAKRTATEALHGNSVVNSNEAETLGQLTEILQTFPTESNQFDVRNPIARNNGILGLGASFMAGGNPALPQDNVWFELMCEKIGVIPYNEALGGTYIDYCANMLYEEEVLGTTGDAPVSSVDAVLIMYTHNRDVFTLSEPFLSYTAEQYEQNELLPFDTPDTDEEYAMMFDYTIKKLRKIFFDYRDTTKSYVSEVQTLIGNNYPKPCQIVLCTHWHDSRPTYNNSVRKLAEKWSLALVQFDRKIGFSKEVPLPNGVQPSIQFTGNIGGQYPIEVIGGVQYGWHPMGGGENVYIQRKMAHIASESFYLDGDAIIPDPADGYWKHYQTGDITTFGLDADMIYEDSWRNPYNWTYNWAPQASEIKIPEGITLIYTGIFGEWYPNLKYLDLPSTIQDVRNWFLDEFTDIERVVIRAVTPPIGAEFGEDLVFDPLIFEGIFVPAQSVDTYKTNPLWSVFADYIKPIQ